jgi:hypothetical protein
LSYVTSGFQMIYVVFFVLSWTLGGSFCQSSYNDFIFSSMLLCVFLGGKCQVVELSGENINITYKHDGTQIAVGNKVCTA